MQKPQLDDLVNVGVHPVEKTRFVGGIGHEQADCIDDLLAIDHQPRVPRDGVEFGELFAQQDKNEADRVAQLAPLYQAWQLRLAGGSGTLAQIRIPFGFIDQYLQSKGGAVITHASLQVHERLPQRRFSISLQHVLQQDDEQMAQAILVGAFDVHAAKIMRGSVACRPRTCSSVQYTVSVWASSIAAPALSVASLR